MHIQTRIDQLEKIQKHKLGERLIHELRFGLELSRANENKWDALLESSIALLEEGVRADGIITACVARNAEEALRAMQAEAKKYEVLCVGHAHIDMNWMWRYDETVSITLDTFRTVLGFLEEYPQFRFSQSQASVYEIVEKYDPEMLMEIKKQVAAGRWEVSASTWVEADRNMPSAESVARHLLYTRRYLSRLLDIDGKTLNFDFEPDTFGHNANVPEMLTCGGVKYYYHCRGDEGETLYRWQSPSGAEIICYRDPHAYGGPLTEEIAQYVPAFCKKYGINKYMKVYGVGDHGGGPTRKDIERLLDMAEWPIFPQFRFGTYQEFFAEAEHGVLPVVKGELNRVFDGCYTTQVRIKQGNRLCEAKLNEAESLAAQTAMKGLGKYPRKLFEESWRNVLFNQFHDIVTGSGIMDTREYAMGTYSKSIAAADTQKSKAMRLIGKQVDTSAYITERNMDETTSEGAGVGFGVGNSWGFIMDKEDSAGLSTFRVAQTDRGRGLNRVFHVFNPSALERTEVVELTMFDWPGDYRKLMVLGADQKLLDFQIIDKDPQRFWAHEYVRVLVKLTIPAGGRSTCICTQNDNGYVALPAGLEDFPLVEKRHIYALENEYLYAQFCPVTGALIRLTDKESGNELIDKPSAFFRLIIEQPDETSAGSSWTVGRYRSIQDLTKNVEIHRGIQGVVRNSLIIKTEVGNSKIKYIVNLSAGSRWLDIQCEIDWREMGVRFQYTPQLNFTLPTALTSNAFIHDIPGGLIERGPVSQDTACQSFAAVGQQGRTLMLLCDSKYGFRCDKDPRDSSSVLSLSCIRSSTEPDPLPDCGGHTFRIGIGVSSTDELELMNTAQMFCHPFSAVSDIPRQGTSSLMEEGIKVSGAFLQTVKLAEDSDALIVRLVNPKKEMAEAEIHLWDDMSFAEVVDAHEQSMPEAVQPVLEGRILRCSLKGNSILNLKIS